MRLIAYIVRAYGRYSAYGCPAKLIRISKAFFDKFTSSVIDNNKLNKWSKTQMLYVTIAIPCSNIMGHEQQSTTEE